MTQDTRPHHSDDIAIWPDGCWATLGDIWDNQFNWKSDDYEIVRLDDISRLRALGLAGELDLDPG